MESLIELWLVSVLHPKKWVKLHTHFSVDTTLLKSLEELKDSKLSRTSKTGLEPGHSKVKVCTTVPNQCNLQERTLLTQLSLIQEVRNFPSLQMFSRKSEKNGPLLFQILIAPPTRLSVTSKTHAKTSPQKLNQSVSKCQTTFLKSTQNNIFINRAIRNVTSSSTSADSQERTRTCS